MTDLLEKYMATGTLDDHDILTLLRENIDLRVLAQRMHVLAEVWPVAADEQGIYALNPEAPWPWPTEPIYPLDHPDPEERKKAIHRAVERELDLRGIDASRRICLHSTSWRCEADALVCHYMCIVRVPDVAAGGVWLDWKYAKPISPNLHTRTGQPRKHAATDAPEDYHFVNGLRHGIRHYAALADKDGLCYDEPIGKALPEIWHRQLANVTPAVAQMFGPVRDVA